MWKEWRYPHEKNPTPSPPADDCKPPHGGGGLAPAITSVELLACVPELADLCAVDAVQVFNLDSTNVGPAQGGQSIVHCIKEKL